MDIETIGIEMIAQGCDDVRTMAKYFDRVISMSDYPDTKSFSFLNHSITFQKDTPFEEFKKLLYKYIERELNSILYCVDLSKLICDDAIYVWDRFVTEIKNEHNTFYACFVEYFDRILERARE